MPNYIPGFYDYSEDVFETVGEAAPGAAGGHLLGIDVLGAPPPSRIGKPVAGAKTQGKGKTPSKPQDPGKPAPDAKTVAKGAKNWNKNARVPAGAASRKHPVVKAVNRTTRTAAYALKVAKKALNKANRYKPSKTVVRGTAEHMLGRIVTDAEEMRLIGAAKSLTPKQKAALAKQKAASDRAAKAAMNTKQKALKAIDSAKKATAAVDAAKANLKKRAPHTVVGFYADHIVGLDEYDNMFDGGDSGTTDPMTDPTLDPNYDPNAGDTTNTDTPPAVDETDPNIPWQHVPADGVPRLAGMGWDRYSKASFTYYNGPQNDNGGLFGMVYGYDHMNAPNSTAKRWIERYGQSGKDNDGKAAVLFMAGDFVTLAIAALMDPNDNWHDEDGGDHYNDDDAKASKKSLAMNYGPLIGRPADYKIKNSPGTTDKYAGLRYAIVDNVWFWPRALAPSWATAEDDAAKAALKRAQDQALADARAAAQATRDQQIAEQQQAQADQDAANALAESAAQSAANVTATQTTAAQMQAQQQQQAQQAQLDYQTQQQQLQYQQQMLDWAKANPQAAYGGYPQQGGYSSPQDGGYGQMQPGYPIQDQGYDPSAYAPTPDGQADAALDTAQDYGTQPEGTFDPIADNAADPFSDGSL